MDIDAKMLSEPVKEIFDYYNIDWNDSNREQFAIFLQALQLFNERNKRYRDQWKETGWRGALYDIVKKGRRLFTQFRLATAAPEATDDDAWDMINFCAFYLRAKQDGNEWGIWGEIK